MDIQILSPFTPTVLVGIGIALVALESFILSFVVLWFGIGFIAIGILSAFVGFDDGIWQIAGASLVALVLLAVLRVKAMEKFLEPVDAKELHEDFLNESGYGVIKDGKVYYKATYWNIEHAEDESYVEGEEVFVESTHKGYAKITKIKK